MGERGCVGVRVVVGAAVLSLRAAPRFIGSACTFYVFDGTGNFLPTRLQLIVAERDVTTTNAAHLLACKNVGNQVVDRRLRLRL